MEKDGNEQGMVPSTRKDRKRIPEVEKPVSATLNGDGHEVVDSVPMAPPVGYEKQPSVTDRIRAMVQSELLRREAAEAGVETFEEADDFDVGDDIDPSTPYEENFDPPPAPPERLTAEEWEARERKRYTSEEWNKLKPARAPSGGAPATEPGGGQPSVTEAVPPTPKA